MDFADDNSSIGNKDDDYQEKLDFEENEPLDENINESHKLNDNASPISINSSNGSLKSSTESLNLNDNHLESIVKNNDYKNDDNLKKEQQSTIIKLKNLKSNDEEGEVEDDSEDDLEDGELKEDDDQVNQSLDNLIYKNKLKEVLCKFYINGACTWGDNCRFKHCDIARANNLSNNHQNLNQSSNRISSNQKYQNKPQQHNRNNSNDYDNTRQYNDYERKRRLALESAPWNYQQDHYENERSSYSKNDNYSSSNRNYSSSSKNYDDYKNQQSNRYVQKDSFHSGHSSSSSLSDLSFSSDKSLRESPTIEKRRKYDHYNETTNTIESSKLNKKSSYRKNNRDRWENDDANSTTSSYFTETESLDNKDDYKKSRKYQHNRSISPSTTNYNRKRNSKSPSKHDDYHHSYSRENSKLLDRGYNRASRTINSGNSHSRSKVEEKKPIKMTFLRKQQSLKKCVQLNNSKDEFDSDDDEKDETDFDAYEGKDLLESKIGDKNNSESKIRDNREELLKRLKEIDEAIARKRVKKT